MLIKLLGSLLIALSGTYFSFSFCKFQRKRLQVLDSYISLLFFIKGQTLKSYGNASVQQDIS